MNELNWKRKPNKYQMREQKENGVAYLTFPLLEEASCARHLFTTRLGGVSKGIYQSMNLSYSRGDEKEAVDENYKTIAKLFQSTPEQIVCSDQTHTTNIRVVTEMDAGKGVTRLRDYTDVDGLLTTKKGLILATFYADCVPIYFIDPVKEVIGLAHSGWKGTVGRIGARMVKRMESEYGCNPSEILTAIGPSICQECYEVSEDVAGQFQIEFKGHETELLQPGKEPGKYQLNLWRANQIILEEAGITKEHIEITDLCTCCNPMLLFSHRASQGKRGNLGAFLMLV